MPPRSDPSLAVPEACVAGPFRGFAATVGLSDQEWAVLAAALEGSSMKEAAARLSLSPKTVETYWRRIYHKTGRRTQLEVIARILRWSLRELPPRSAGEL